jgi:predicted nuclease of predicted toxin-antitoxin system
MKLLFDHNLSPKLVAQLIDLYPQSSHVALIGLSTASDITVWQYARQEGYCLVTKDSDFNDLLTTSGFPPKVIWIRLGNCRTAEVAALLRKYHEVIIAFSEDMVVGLLELQ